MMIAILQGLMILFFGGVLVVAMRLRTNGENITIANTVEQIQQTLATGLVILTREQRWAIKKARKNRRLIGWAGRRLIQGHPICGKNKKRFAFRHLTKMAQDTDSRNVNRVLAILEELAKGNGDKSFQTKAMELLTNTSPRRALKLQVRMNKAKVVKMPESNFTAEALPQAA